MVEPLLGPIDMQSELWEDLGEFIWPGWIVVGGESGPKARPMHPDWVRSLRDQCVSAGIPFFFKQGSAANWPAYKDFALFPLDLQIREFPHAP